MDKVQRRTVVGIFDEPQQAQRAIDALHDAGFTDEQIGFIRRGGDTVEGTTPIATGAGHPAGAGLGTGAVIGGLLGAAAALLIPGVGPVVAGGVIANTFGASLLGGVVAGAAVGAIAGGLLGALTDMGVPEEDARYANEQFEAGRTIVTVDDVARYTEAESILRRFGAHDIQGKRAEASPTATLPPSSVAAPSTAAIPPVERMSDMGKRDELTVREDRTQRATGAQEIRLPVTEEKLVPQKHAEETGAVNIRKTVVEETETIQVPVRREEVTVERVRTDRPLAPGEKPFTEETLRVPVTAEQVTVAKEARVVGEVVIEKERHEEQQPVAGTVRRQEVHVEQTGTGGTASSRPWTEVMPTYRTSWQQRVGSTGGRWEVVEPAYRFGYEASSGSTYHGRSWDQAEADLRRDWALRDPRTPWEKVRDSIHDVWARARTGT